MLRAKLYGVAKNFTSQVEIIKSIFIEGKGYEFDLSSYPAYLESIKGRLPRNALAFASAPWHYTPDDRRCPHDSWVEQLQITAAASGQRNEVRGLEISVRLLGAYHDGHIEILYTNVQRYTMEISRLEGSADGHGEWLIDEIRLSQSAKVIHEVQFVRGRWTIECDDVTYHWRNFLH